LNRHPFCPTAILNGNGAFCGGMSRERSRKVRPRRKAERAAEPWFFSRRSFTRRFVGLLDAGAERGSGGDGGKGEDFFEPAGMTQMGVFNAKALGFQTGKTKFNAPALAVDLKRIVAAFQAMRDNGKKFAIGQTFQRQRTPHAIKSGLRPCLRFLRYKAFGQRRYFDADSIRQRDKLVVPNANDVRDFLLLQGDKPACADERAIRQKHLDPAPEPVSESVPEDQGVRAFCCFFFCQAASRQSGCLRQTRRC
jgi:hypothetical protein